MKQLLGICLLVVAAPVLASNPGEPLSYEDWESIDPSFPLSVTVPPGDCLDEPKLRCNANTTFGIDAAGMHWAFQQTPIGTCLSATLFSLDLVRCEENLDTCVVVARLPSRCYFRPVGGLWCTDTAVPEAVWIDNTSGKLFFRYFSTETGTCAAYPHTREVIRVGGLPTLFENLQSYEPTANQIGFRVPYMPEGFPAADWFNTYYGDLATVGDWSQAQPLQCGYPAAAPSVGDYLTVNDPLPDPRARNGPLLHHQRQLPGPGPIRAQGQRWRAVGARPGRAAALCGLNNLTERIHES